jgi:hypothetical protein
MRDRYLLFPPASPTNVVVLALARGVSISPRRRARLPSVGVARVGGAGLGRNDTHTHAALKNRTINSSAGDLRFSYNLHAFRSECGSKSSRLRELNRVPECTHCGLGDIRSYDPAASLVVTLREGSHARFEPLEHRAPVRALRCTLRPTLTPHPAQARAPLSLSLSLSLSHALRIRKRPGQRFSGSAIPHASPGTAFLRERNSARIARDGA